ncbi:MAG: 4-aminobutyrate--2-oxoglutarate transaminase [Myxococcales bacterium]|nr:4-aminobutyrate--2-oxoglutarate transaminase [Myxococcales bacterium]
MGAIDLVTEIPGPKSREMLARRAAAVAAGLAKSTEVVVESASGARLRDVDGNTLLDFAGGIGMLAAGHCPPEVVRAVQEQAAKLLHVCAIVATYEPYVRLSELLNEVTPGAFPKKTLLCNSGSEAVENAVKIARTATGRAAVICFEGAYHGRTLLTLSLTSKYGLFKKGFGPFAPEIYRLPAPDVYRRPAQMTEDEYVSWCIQQLDRALVAQIDPSALAAIIIEPVQGEAGFIPMPARFLQRIREICDQHGAVMIADEVQSGFGRTGKLFAIEHYGIVPDLITTAKSLGAGMPIAAVTGRAELMDAPHVGGIGGTYGGAPVACAAAIEAVQMIRKPEFLARASAVGARMCAIMDDWKSSSELVGDVRGLGAMMLCELVLDRTTREPSPALTLEIIKAAARRGLVLIRAGLYSNCIRLLPPLVITDDELEEGMAVLGDEVRAASERLAASRK